MESFLIMLKNVTLFVLLALPGYILVKTKLLHSEQSGVLSKVLLYAGMPFLIITSTLKLSLNGEFIITSLLVALVGVVFTLIFFFASAPLTKWEKEAGTRGMMRFCSVFSNNGFLGLPLAIAVFGADSPVVSVLIILNIITNISIFTLGVYLVSGDKETISIKKALLSPVLIGFVVGIILNLLKVTEHVPEVATYSTHFNNIVTPISMTVLGMKMGNVKFLDLFKNLKTYYVALLKLILFPVVSTGILICLKELVGGLFDYSIIMGTLIAFAVPSGGLAPALADRYGGDTDSAVAFTLGTTILSIATIPLLYWLANLIIA